MGKFVSEYRLVIVAVSLPLLLIVVLLGVLGVSRLLAEPPAYPVLYAQFSAQAVPAGHDLRIGQDGRLQILWRDVDPPPWRAEPRLPGAEITLVLHDAARETTEFFPVERPENPASDDEPVELEIPARLAGLRFLPGGTAPDGTRFEAYGRRSGGLFAELFGGRSRNSGQRLVKDGVSWALPEAGIPQGWRAPALVGWVDGGSDD